MSPDVHSPAADLARLSRVFAALSDPTRLRIVELLAAGERTGAEVAESLAISPPLACHHLKQLVEAGLIERRRAGQAKYGVLNRLLLRTCFEQFLERLR